MPPSGRDVISIKSGSSPLTTSHSLPRSATQMPQAQEPWGLPVIPSDFRSFLAGKGNSGIPLPPP